ncbi:hypothetical protein Pint_28992 [Pistacia integerrima]|uniref:Uncharacterized protein n=1 Tax=Pistacia integerrima TaxID=434235 RepID=A0ACC0X2A4_9ROSI|nr:hypothetical protein Pint_28992 [Pistacia integerrima]
MVHLERMNCIIEHDLHAQNSSFRSSNRVLAVVLVSNWVLTRWKSSGFSGTCTASHYSGHGSQQFPSLSLIDLR